MAFDFAMVAGFLFFSGIVLWVLLLIGRFLRMRVPGAEKATTYECGERPFGSAWFNFNNRFYIIALVFVALDVLVALAVPVVTVFRRMLAEPQATLVFVALFIFLGLAMVALAYVWSHGDLTWVRELPVGECVEVEIGKKQEGAR
jgi:NADH-quinone oxidoreductase subunit A